MSAVLRPKKTREPVHPRINAGAVGPLTPRASGALHAPKLELLAVADLHFGRAARATRRGGPLLPPYEVSATLSRLESEVSELQPKILVFLGDSFDDAAAPFEVRRAEQNRLKDLARGRRVIWIKGNHDPQKAEGSIAAGVGEQLDAFFLDDVAFRHFATPRDVDAGASLEISGHLHPKAVFRVRGRSFSRRCFAADAPVMATRRRSRVILPAFGEYTGGLDLRERAFDPLVGSDATAFVTGSMVAAVPRRSLAAL